MPTTVPTASLFHVIDKMGNPADSDFHFDPNKLELEIGSKKSKYRVRGSTINEIIRFLEQTGGSEERKRYFANFKAQHCNGNRGAKSLQVGDSALLKLSANKAISVSCTPYADDGDKLQLARATYNKDHIRIDILSPEQSAEEEKSGNWTARKSRAS